MILKYLTIATLTLWWITAADPNYGIELSWQQVPAEQKDEVRELAWMSTESFRPYLEDSDDRVSDRFPVTEYFYPTVNFWFMIYTQFESSQVVIHDKSNLSLIYKVLDFSSLKEKGLHRNTLYVLQQKLSEEKKNELKSDLDHLVKNPFSLELRAKNIYRMLANAGIQVPVKKVERAAFFNELKANVRTQTGQKNFIRDGIVRSLPYKTFLNKYFPEHGLPPELLAIPFLESSFNPRAESRVGALGPWQFMPFIGTYYMPKRTSQIDYRSNVGVASVSAANLMKENYFLMKSWDLAVTAYNSGTKHLLKTKRELASSRPKIDLETVIKFSDSERFGFASKNFYSEFLALVHALAYEEELFPDIHKEDRYNVNEDLDFYLTKCSLRVDKVLNKKQLDDVIYYNHQIKDESKTLPRGSILTSKEALPSGRFFKISFKHLVSKKPKQWPALLGNQSCSTR